MIGVGIGKKCCDNGVGGWCLGQYYDLYYVGDRY